MEYCMASKCTMYNKYSMCEQPETLQLELNCVAQWLTNVMGATVALTVHACSPEKLHVVHGIDHDAVQLPTVTKYTS